MANTTPAYQHVGKGMRMENRRRRPLEESHYENRSPYTCFALQRFIRSTWKAEQNPSRLKMQAKVKYTQLGQKNGIMINCWQTRGEPHRKAAAPGCEQQADKMLKTRHLPHTSKLDDLHHQSVTTRLLGRHPCNPSAPPKARISMLLTTRSREMSPEWGSTGRSYMSHGWGWAAVFKMTHFRRAHDVFTQSVANPTKKSDRSQIQRWNAQNKWAGKLKVLESILLQIEKWAASTLFIARYTVFTSTTLVIWGNGYTPQFLLHAFFLLERYCLPKRNFSSTGKTIFPINLRKPKIPNGIKMIFPLPPP